MEYRPDEYKLADIGEPYGHKLTEKFWFVI